MFFTQILNFAQKATKVFSGPDDPALRDNAIGKSISELQQYLTVNHIKFEFYDEPMKALIPEPKVSGDAPVDYDGYRGLIINREKNNRVLIRYDLYLRKSRIALVQEDFGYKNPYQS